ncbi:hypothetical protein BV881_28180 [Streptomyces sp. ZL-24]|nr:hypothetical protein BV881_28180 [Streptomyces sp. ZL-24]
MGGWDTNAVAIGLAGGVASLCFQALPGEEWSGWGALAEAPVTFRSTAIAGIESDDVMAAVAIGTDGTLYYADSPASAGWSTSWTLVGHPPSALLDGGCAIALASDATSYAAAVGTDGGLWSVSRPLGGSWSSWVSHGAPSGLLLTGPCALSAVPGGGLAAAATASNGQLYALFPALTGAWTCIGHPQPALLQGPVAVAAASANQLTAFAVGTDDNGYLASLGKGTVVFTSLGQPVAAPLAVTALSVGMLPAPRGGLTVLAPAVNGTVYCIESQGGDWVPLAPVGTALPLRSVTGNGEHQYSVSVAAPGTAQVAPDRPRLQRGEIVLDSTFTLTVEATSTFLLAAVQDAEGQSIPGIGLTVTRPDGTVADKPSPPNDDNAVVHLNDDGYVTSMLIKAPTPGLWKATVVGSQPDDEDFQVTLTTLPVLNVRQTIAATLQEMREDTLACAEPAAGESWGCTACRFGAYAGALLVAGAIAYGVVMLTPESAVVIWLADLIGISAEASLAFIGSLANKGATSIPAIVTAICKFTGSCSS